MIFFFFLVSSVMKLNPQQAPLYGECLLTVQLCDEDRFCDEEDVEFYLLFSGSTQRHLTSTLRISHVTLQAICPAHNCCESVQVTLCLAKPGGSVDLVAEQHFQFVQDLAFDMAQFLVSSAGRDDGLDGALLLDECQIPLLECEKLDKNLALALRHLALPEGWSVLGTNLGRDVEPAPQETLLHFAARRGLRQVAVFLLQQPGGREALRLPNRQGATPLRLAEKKGYKQLQQIFSRAETAPGTRTKASQQVYTGDHVLRHHPRLDTYTLTVDTPIGCAPPDLQRDIDELRRLICWHRDNKQQIELLKTKQDHNDNIDTATEDLCLESLGDDPEHTEGEALTPAGAEESENDGAGENRHIQNCETERGTRHCLEATEHSLNSGRLKSTACKDQKEGEAEPHVASKDDCGEVAGSGVTAQNQLRGESCAFYRLLCAEQQEEAHREQGVASTETQSNLEELGTQTQATADSEPEVQAADMTLPTIGVITGKADMGHAQSQGHLRTSEGEDHMENQDSCEAELSEEEMKGSVHGNDLNDLSRGEERENQSHEVVNSGPDGLKNKDGIDSMEVAGIDSDCSCLSVGGQMLHEQEDACEATEQNLETASQDFPEENEHNDSEMKNNQTEKNDLVSDDFGRVCTNLETETASLIDQTCRNTESDCATTDLPEAKSTAEYVRQTEKESCSVDMGSCTPPPARDLALCDAQLSPKPTEHVVEDMAGLEESPHCVFEFKEEASTEGGPASIFTPDKGSSYTEVNTGQSDLLSASVTSSNENSHQPVSTFINEFLYLPEECTATEVTGEPVSKPEEDMKMEDNMRKALEMEEGCLQLESQVPLEGTTEFLTEAECRTLLGTEITEEATCPDASCITDSDGRPIEVSTYSSQLADGHKEPELKREIEMGGQQTTQRSARTETPPPTDAVSAEIYLESQSPADVNLEEPIKVQVEQKDGYVCLGTRDSVPELSETEMIVHSCLSVNNELLEIISFQEVLEEPKERPAGKAEEMVTCGYKAEECTEQADMENNANEITSDGHSAAPVKSPQPAFETAASDECDMGKDFLKLTEPSCNSGRGIELTDTLQRTDEVFEEGTDDLEANSQPVMDGDEGQQISPFKGGTEPAEDVKDTQGALSSLLETDIDDAEEIQREKNTFYSFDACAEPSVLDRTQRITSVFPESPQSAVGLGLDSSVSITRQDSCGDTDAVFSPYTTEDNVFKKGEESVTRARYSQVWASCSSAEGAASLAGSPVRCGEAEEEEKDRLTEVPLRAAILRSSIRSLSPFRRHSWGPGKNPGGEAEMSQRSSLRSLGDGKPTFHRRSLSWCPTGGPLNPNPDQISSRSYSLEGLIGDRDGGKDFPQRRGSSQEPRRASRLDSEERGSLVSLTEEEQESDLADCSSLDSQSGQLHLLRRSSPSITLPLMKSVSMLAISQKELDGRTRPKRRISFSFNISPILPKSKTFFSIGSSSSDEEEPLSKYAPLFPTVGASPARISEEDPGPLRSDIEVKGGTKVSRTFSYLKNKMYKKTKEKDKERSRDKERDLKEKEKDKRALNGHLFSTVNSSLLGQCHQCTKAINTKEAAICTNCNAHVHKSCRENLPACAKVKMKQQKPQFPVPDSATAAAVTMRTKGSATIARDRPWSAIATPEDPPPIPLPRRHTSVMAFSGSNLSKSVSISNIAGPALDEAPLKGLRYLSQSTDSLHKTGMVNESTESLTDEGTEMMDSQLMGEFEADAKELEADSWSFTVDKKYLKQLKKDVINRQDVIYELIQTEMHHVRTLRIMWNVYSKGLQKEVQLDTQTVERMFPMLDDLLDIHTHFFANILDRKRESQLEGKDGGFVIRRIGDVLVEQFSGSNADRMKKVYGEFCSRHNEAVNFYKELHTRDKRFQAFIKKKMSSTIVRRLGIPECILLVTQRITKYPVLLQRILQHTKESEEDHKDVAQALQLVKEVIAAVDGKVNEQEKKKRLKEVYSRTDSKSIMRMKSGQMFAREDLVRGRKLLHDGPLQLKSSAGRLKDVQAVLLSDVFVFLQEKDQKYVFASLDQRATVISLQKLIVREVANEEKGLFLITAGIEKPEMVEVHASSKEERNTWMQIIQDAMQEKDKDEDEGIPSETEEDRRLHETKTKELRGEWSLQFSFFTCVAPLKQHRCLEQFVCLPDQLRKKDEQIVALLEEKVKLFGDMCECSTPEDTRGPRTRMLFRASSDDMPKGEPILKDALKEVETLQALVNGSLGGAVGQQVSSTLASPGGAISLPRRAETFGGFDSHQMNISKNAEKDEGDESADLRRTESDSVLKKAMIDGGGTNLLLLLKRNSEQLLNSISHLHELLNTLKAVVVQQDTFIEDQRQALNERPCSRGSSRHNSRPSSLVEQEKQRSLEKQRQEAAELLRQQTAHAEERRRWEREWEVRKQELVDRESLLHTKEEEVQRRHTELEEEHRELRERKEEYQRDLERLRDAQRRLDRDREHLNRELEKMEEMRHTDEKRMHRTPSSTSEDSLRFQSSVSLDNDPGESRLSSSPKDSLFRTDSKWKGKNLNPFAVNPSQKPQNNDGTNQIPSRLLQLAKTKDKKEKKKKKKSKGQNPQSSESPQLPVSDTPVDGEIFFC
ncbi:A-kinase anchor protein 13-like isoform X6 [Arapaima gigas]